MFTPGQNVFDLVKSSAPMHAPTALTHTLSACPAGFRLRNVGPSDLAIIWNHHRNAHVAVVLTRGRDHTYTLSVTRNFEVESQVTGISCDDLAQVLAELVVEG